MRCTKCFNELEPYNPQNGFGTEFDKEGRCESCQTKKKKTEERIGKLKELKSHQGQEANMKTENTGKVLPFSKEAQAGRTERKSPKQRKEAAVKAAKKPGVKVAPVVKAPAPTAFPKTTRGNVGQRRDELIVKLVKSGVIKAKDILVSLRKDMPAWKASDPCAMSYIYRGIKAANAS